MHETLTTAVLEFQRTGQGWKVLHEKICLIAYAYPERWTNWHDDDRSEFFASFLPKIPGLVSRYRSQGKSFEAYLQSSLRWFLSTHARRRACENDQDRFMVRESTETAEFTIESSTVGPESLSSEPSKRNEVSSIDDPVKRKRFTYFVLLHAAGLTDDMIPQAAALIGQPVDWLETRVETVRKIVAGKIAKRKELRERRNECWYRRSSLLHRIEEETDPEKIARWTATAKVWLQRFQAAQDSIDRIRPLPSHQEIADLVGVPKGTVDSGLWLIRKDFTRPKTKAHPIQKNKKPSGSFSFAALLPPGRRPA